MDQQVEQLLKEIKELEVRYNDPKETLCKHCINLSMCERYDKLREIGYLKYDRSSRKRNI